MLSPMPGVCNTYFLILKSFKYYVGQKLTYMGGGNNFLFNSMVQDIKELMLAGTVKECFFMVMILDRIFEGSAEYRIFINSFWESTEKTFFLREEDIQ